MKNLDDVYEAAVAKIIGGEYRASINLLQLYLKNNPNNSDAHHNLGVSLFQLNRFDEAANCFEEAKRISPHKIESINNLGLIFIKRGQILEAIKEFERVLSINDNYSSALNNLSLCYKEMGNYKEALNFLNRILSKSSDSVEALNNRALIYFLMRQFEFAKSDLKHVLQINSDSLEARKIYGLLKLEIGDFAAALKLFNEVLIEQPDDKKTLFNKSLILLIQGYYEEGFQLYEYRFEAGAVGGAQWGKQRTPKLLNLKTQETRFYVRFEQGLGDLIQNFRFVKLLKRLGFHVELEAPKTLHSLFLRSCTGLIINESCKSCSTFQYVCSIMSLPYIFNLKVDQIPLSSGYLKASYKKTNFMRTKLEGRRKFRLGICWSSTSKFPGDYKRSIPFDMFKKIFRGFELDIVVLQKEMSEKDRRKAKRIRNLFFFGRDLRTFDDTASLALGCDLVITTCTSVPHLTGALGIKTLLIVSTSPDWRWGESEFKSRWYDSITIIRQEVFLDWDHVIIKVRRILRLIVNRYPSY